ncbi:MAG: aldo/keto reductase [Phycisphaerae bacterium]|nr:aldo/keto reductase [Phycisphaerae bacterium]
MQYGELDAVSKPVSRVVQGMIMLSDTRQDEASRLLDAAFEAQITGFDTAHAYGGGSSERAFGRWVADRGIRDRVVLLDKGAHPYDGRSRVTPDDITADINDSLDRLGFDHIEIYLLHRDDPNVPVGEIVDALNAHHAAGRIGAFGGSNWTHDRIAAANAYARDNGRTGFAVSSPQLSLAEMLEEPWDNCVSISGPHGTAARRWYADNDVAVFAWSSLGRGFLSGAFTRENLSGDVSGSPLRDARMVQRCYASDDNFRRLARLRQIADERGLSVPQLALGYVLNLPLDAYALAAGYDARQCGQNAAATEVALSEAEMAWLELRRDAR